MSKERWWTTRTNEIVTHVVNCLEIALLSSSPLCSSEATVSTLKSMESLLFKIIVHILSSDTKKCKAWLENLRRLVERTIRAYYGSLLHGIRRKREERHSVVRSNRVDSASLIVTTSKTTTVTVTCKMELLRLFLDNNPEVRSLINCFQSEASFENSMRLYDAPTTRDTGGFFGLACKSYTMNNRLEECLFNVCLRFRKEDLYPLIRQQLRENVATIKLIQHIILNAMELRKEPEEILAQFADVSYIAYKYMLNVLYCWLMSIDEQHLQVSLNRIVDQLRVVALQLPPLIQRYKNDFLECESVSNDDEATTVTTRGVKNVDIQQRRQQQQQLQQHKRKKRKDNE